MKTCTVFAHGRYDTMHARYITSSTPKQIWMRMVVRMRTMTSGCAHARVVHLRMSSGCVRRVTCGSAIKMEARTHDGNQRKFRRTIPSTGSTVDTHAQHHSTVDTKHLSTSQETWRLIYDTIPSIEVISTQQLIWSPGVIPVEFYILLTGLCYLQYSSHSMYGCNNMFFAHCSFYRRWGTLKHYVCNQHHYFFDLNCWVNFERTY